jgi:hypothetical protein
MTNDTSPAPRWRARRPAVRFSLALARRICGRVAGGESLLAICESPGMPHAKTVSDWIGKRPRFAAMMAAARAAAGQMARSAQLSTFCAGTANVILERMSEGETLVAICRDPAMPSFSTVYRWLRAFPDFADDYREARQAQAERLADLGLEIAEGVTAQTAHATAVRLVQLRWTAGVFAPRRFGRYRPVDAELPQQVRTILFRHFKIEKHPETGQRRVVSYTPDPETMMPVRDHEGPWERLRDTADFSPEQMAADAADMARMTALEDG